MARLSDLAVIAAAMAARVTSSWTTSSPAMAACSAASTRTTAIRAPSPTVAKTRTKRATNTRATTRARNRKRLALGLTSSTAKSVLLLPPVQHEQWLFTWKSSTAVDRLAPESVMVHSCSLFNSIDSMLSRTSCAAAPRTKHKRIALYRCY